MLENLRARADKLLQMAQNQEEVEKYKTIQNILANEKCFFELPLAVSVSILQDLKVPEDKIGKIIIKLLSKEEYDKLY